MDDEEIRKLAEHCAHMGVQNAQIFHPEMPKTPKLYQIILNSIRDFEIARRQLEKAK